MLATNAHMPNPVKAIIIEIPPARNEPITEDLFTAAKLRFLFSVAFCIIEKELKIITKKTTLESSFNSGASK